MLPQRKWARVAIYIAGAWIVAIFLLLVAFWLRGDGQT